MKMPELPKPNAHGSPRLRVPGPVEDLFRDLRDRRLLLPALVLVVAVAAVPLALSADREPAPAPLAVQPPEGAEAVTPAVLTEQPSGVRDYRERLDELKAKNPFAGAFGSSAASGPGPADTDDTPPGPTPSATPSTSGSTAPSPRDDGGAPAAPAAPADGDDAAPEPERIREVLTMAPRLEALAGRVGHLRRVEDAELSDLLPSRRSAPLAMFIGTSNELGSAHFAISDNVTKTRGEGRCSPRPNDCEFLKLDEGDKRYFTVDGARYAIKVVAVSQVIVDRRKVEDE